MNPKLVERYRAHPGRGGCGVGAIADLSAKPSREIVELGLAGLRCLEHRGGAIEDTADGAGILLTIEREFFERFIAKDRHLPAGHALAIGVCFFPRGEATNLPHWQREIDQLLRRQGLAPLGWRHVPIDENGLGRSARENRRDVWQVLVGEGMVPEEDLGLVLWRTKAILESRIHDLYLASFSHRTVVYKALATGVGLGQVYPDLLDPALTARAVVFHRRYSTNTFSNWTLAQTFRLLGHNGEINTIKANRNATENLQAEIGVANVLMPQGSDSADLDRVVELFVSHGVSLPEAVVRVMPMAWKDLAKLTPEVVRYHQGVQRALGSLGAWEGPAAIVATDGRHLVGSLDRMGLRPLRWLRTTNGRVVVASEMGAVPIDPATIAEAGQLDPGEVIAVDLEKGILHRPDEVLASVVANTSINFAELAETRLTSLPRREQAPKAAPKPDNAVLNLFGWTSERVRNIKHMAANGKEAITSMGYDRPLPPLSGMRPPLTKFFKQIVAVVTNPPIDPIREGGAFDLTVHLGAAPAVYENRPVYEPRPQVRLPSPILTDDQAQRIAGGTGDHLPAANVIDATFEDPANGLSTGAKAVSRRIAELVRDVVGQVKRDEISVVILSDRAAAEPPGEARPALLAEGQEPPYGGQRPRLPLPMVLMNAALHNGLTEAGVRRRASIVVETGEIQEGHDAAVLLATGADAVHPWLFYQVGAPHGPVANLAAALDETLKRAMSKMGICSVDGYRGSRLFEAVGLDPSVVDHYLPGITTRLGGLGLEELYDDLRARRALGGAPQSDPDLAVYRKAVWEELQTTARGHDPESFGRFLALVADTPPVYLRDLLVLREDAPIPEDEVAPLEEIIRWTFRGAAMSHGALHRVAHRAIAAAFNKYGAMSNCGEGGEDERRDRGQPWEESRSRIRQVASGRFGVDARYLAHADELSIKIGQGAKPGEGGMLPGTKVTAEVAAIRKTQIGVTLISPPPHHDIYSIEDLAQLVYDLKQANPRARVSVKIPAVTDIGTIAVGIAKAGADVIDVSGFEGGTGAATSSSIEHAGLPLERGLSETHQALVVAGVRDRVRLRADGGIKTGFDVAAVLALGADEVSLGTALMIAEQCIFCHGCAAGMCPAGITTQSDLVARRLMTIKKGRGKDEALPDLEDERYQDAKLGVERYLMALAGDLRRHLAKMGLRHPRELTGRVDRLARKELPADPTGARRYDKVDLSDVLLDPWDDGSGAAARTQRPRRPEGVMVDPTSDVNRELVTRAAAGETTITRTIANTDRTVGATLAGAIALGEVKPSAPITIALTGVAGQALGFACVDGMRLDLDGYANDKVGAAMSGGAIVVRPPAVTPAEARAGLSLIGNAAAYGATGGALFIAGRAGQRVGVRNSGATIVVEGAGKYAFEYMTGGVGVVLGPVGPVVGSGMTGGALYLQGDAEALAPCLHGDVVQGALGDEDVATLRGLLEAHAAATGSTRAKQALAGLGPRGAGFVKIAPKA